MIKLSVHKIIDLLHNSGDIDNRVNDSSAMYLGAAAHREIQKNSGKEYKKEVSLKFETEIAGIPILIQGRADGISYEANGGIIIDEIKTTGLPISHLYTQQEKHLAQAKCYACLFLKSSDEPVSHIAVQLTYFQLESRELKRHKWEYSADELEIFFANLLEEYSKWLLLEIEFKKIRDISANKLEFPFKTYRKGQRELAVAVYKTIMAEKKLYSCAPTGIGKTLSALFPAIKAMGKGRGEKIFYLTAKTVTRVVAEDAIRLMSAQGLRFKSVTLRAKEKICINNDFICNPDHCSYAKGHFNRVNDALYNLIDNNDLITPPLIEKYANKYHVCPHELVLDASLWCDLVIGDYNHVFHPDAFLRRFFYDDSGDYVFLIDEAHNLADRVRDMYTAEISKQSLSRIKRHLRGKDAPTKALRKALKQTDTYFADIRKEMVGHKTESEEDVAFAELIMAVSRAAEEWMQFNKNTAHELFDDILDLYFKTIKFLMVSELYDSHYITITEAEAANVSITLFCLDPSQIIAKGLAKARASILFSATLSPLAYYKETLGGGDEDGALYLNSPFDPNRLATISHCGISTKYIDREASYAPIAEALHIAVSRMKGNYLAFFPSYDYMRRVHELFCDMEPQIETMLQQSQMSEAEREGFLARFDADNPETLLGFTVLGGIFSEGIDLKGNRLIGSLIISVGIPMISLRRDLIRDYFNEKNGRGYDYAYVYPGMNKVLQAAGRVIRTEDDFGIVLLIDSRYGTPKYKELFPAHWLNMKHIRKSGEIGDWW